MSNTDLGATIRYSSYQVGVRLGDGDVVLTTVDGRAEWTLNPPYLQTAAVSEAELRYVDHQGNQVSVKKRIRIRFF